MVVNPDLEIELSLRGQGYCLIVGLDEAGRGAWAGPVVAGAVILPLERADLCQALAGVRDSKQLSPAQRARLLPAIREVALGIGTGLVPACEIDQIGIMGATRKAMMAAVASLDLVPDFLIIDALRLPRLATPQQAITKGDVKSLCIAAASIVAKVTRDQWMIEQDQELAGYGFAAHKGYGTPMHREALQRLGPTPIHRMSFAPLHRLLD